MAFYIIQNENSQNRDITEPIHLAFKKIKKVASAGGVKDILFYAETALILNPIIEYLKRNPEICKSLHCQNGTERSINYYNNEGIVLSYMPTNKAISFLSRIYSAKAIFIIPHKMEDIEELVENYDVTIIKKDGGEKIIRCDKNKEPGKTMREISKRTMLDGVGPNVGTKANQAIAEESLDRMIESQRGIKPEKIERTAIVLGLEPKSSKKIRKLYEKLIF